uniref:Apple domain-containing protein n=1 Tax=Ascaris lumbricoides TaxID=6252 RepID=A0A0M3HQ47_ASCLU
MWHIFLLLLQMVTTSTSAHKCNPIYVRWPRVKVVFGARAEGPYSLMACRSACTSEEDPMRSGNEMQCSGFNQREGPSDYAHHCQLYQADQLQHVDGFVEADDRYSFYWKYCVHSQKTCSGDYAFTFLSDRYMDSREVTRVAYTSSLEDCLSACLDESNFACRSVSFNRTDGGCHLSQQNQLSKPALLRMNNNPNFRIDYYESNCFNSKFSSKCKLAKMLQKVIYRLVLVTDSFAFEYECKDDGILVKVDSKYPYTGALYGLYDFFTCRVEPKDAKRIEYFFPSPTVSKNCSDSIRYKGNDMVLEVVLSTDGIEPLYFITPDDLTYQARCPIREGKYLSPNIDLLPNIER